jgi:TetR/AcrR family transcriptional regulator, regulator of autoinduction and epiphytic fitness
MQAMSSTATTPQRRRYNTTRRSLQAAQTRSDVLSAAVRLFTAGGWSGTTIAAVAAEAGVSVETVYSGFGSKKGLLRGAIDVAVVGDAEPVPFVERDAFASLARGDREARLEAGVGVIADIHERSAGVWRAIMEAAVGDPDVDAWRLELERGRRVDLRRSVAAILGAEPDETTIDILWVLFGPEIYLKLTTDAGRSRAEYEAYVRRVFTSVTTPEAAPTRRARQR